VGRILVTALCLLVWRVFAHVPVPWINLHGAAPTESVSVVALGLGPYVGALALIVVVRTASSTFNTVIRSGSIARYRSWEIAFTAVTAALAAQRHIDTWQTATPPSLPGHMSWTVELSCVLALTAGTLTLYALGQVINLWGIGFGGSSAGPLLIYALDILLGRGSDFASAVARHGAGSQLQDLRYLLVAAMAIGLMSLTVAVDRAFLKITYRARRSYPTGGTAIARDLEVVVSQELPAGELLRTIQEAGGDVLESAMAIGEYRGGLSGGRKRVAFVLTFRSLTRTLTDTEVDAHLEAIQSALHERQPTAEQPWLPFRLLSSGIVVPVLLANALAYSPAALAVPLASSPAADVRHAAAALIANWRPDGPLVAVDSVFLAVHAALIVAFVIFVAWFWQDPYSIGNELQGLSITIPGVRVGRSTGRYLGRVLTRLSFVGGVYLAFAVVVMPVLAAWVTGIPTREAYFDGFAIVLAAWVGLTIVGRFEHGYSAPAG